MPTSSPTSPSTLDLRLMCPPIVRSSVRSLVSRYFRTKQDKKEEEEEEEKSRLPREHPREHKCCPSSNLEKVRPDPKREFFPLFEYLNTKVGGDNIFFQIFSGSATDTTFARVELVRSVSESAFDFLSGDLPSFPRAGRASVHTPRCSHQCSPPTTLAEDLAPISAWLHGQWVLVARALRPR